MDKLAFWVYSIVLILTLYFSMALGKTKGLGLKTRLNKIDNFQGKGLAYNFQARAGDGDWQYVAYDNTWATSKHPSTIICKKKHQRLSTVFANRDHPGELQFHLVCNGTEKAISHCRTADIKPQTSKYNVGIQCYGGTFDAMYDPASGKRVKYTEL